MALLVAATAISIAIGDATEGIAIAAILVLNGALGFWQEAVADRAILALSQAFTQSALVVRDGHEQTIPSEEVVPGDVLVVSAGERVAADARLLGTASLDVDESALTGESLPVAKDPAAVPAGTPLADRTPILSRRHGGHARRRAGARLRDRRRDRDGRDRAARRRGQGAADTARAAARPARPADGRARRRDHGRRSAGRSSRAAAGWRRRS